MLKRLLPSCTLLVLVCLQAASAQGNPFAALEVVSQGAQTFDVATGITTLEDGGHITDHDSGVVLSGDFIRFREGDFVEVMHARVEGDFGVIEAPSIRLDIAHKKLAASQGVHFAGGDLRLNSEALTIHLLVEIAVATGHVSGDHPPFAAQSAVVDLAERSALLIGPYQYRDGPLTLSGESPDDLLSLHWQAPSAAGGEAQFEASTEPAPERLAKLEPYMP